MAAFLADNFTAADDTLLTAHNPDTGGAASWVVAGGGYSSPVVHGNRLTAADALGASFVATNTTAPGTADYSVQAVFRCVSDAGDAGIGARLDADGNGYWIKRSGNYWMLMSRVGGGDSWYGGSGSVPATPGTDYTVKLEVEGTTQRLYVDTVLIDTRTNADHAGPGRAGVWCNGSDGVTGWHLDTLTTDTIGAGGSAPATPTGLAASDDTYADRIELSWNAAATATSYDLQVSIDGGSVYNTLVTGVAGTSYSHTDLPVGAVYFYKVRATNGYGSSAYSAAEQGSTVGGGTSVVVGSLTTVPMTRSFAYDLTYTGGSAGTTTCTVEWSDDAGATWQDWLPADRLDDLSGTKRFRGAIFDLDPSATYKLRLTVVDDAGIAGTNPTISNVTTLALRHGKGTPAAVLAGTIDYYVRTDGNDANTGTANNAGGAWKTFGKVKTALAGTSGKVVQVAASATSSYTADDVWFDFPVTLIASNPAADDDGAVTAGDHAVIEYGTGSNNPKISGPAGSQATYPQVTEAPWISDGTILDALGTTRTVYYWQTNYRPTHIGYAATRFGALNAIAPCGPAGAWDAYTVAQWKSWIADNPAFHSGWVYWAATGRIYLIMPDAAQNPNTLYLTLSGGTGVEIAASAVRFCGFVWRGFYSAIQVGQPTAQQTLIDHNWFDQCTQGVFVRGDKDVTPNTYPAQPIVTQNRFTFGNLWSRTQADTGVQDHTCIPWSFVKGSVTDGTVNIYKPAQDYEGDAVFFRGGSRGFSFTDNVVIGTFNGLTSYNPSYDLWASFGLESIDNTYSQIPDDALEPEQTASCWVSLRDHFDETGTGLSTGPVNYGPIYMVRGQLWRWGALGTGWVDDGSCGMGPCVWKYGSESVPMARIYWIHCTAWSDSDGVGYDGVEGFAHYAGGGDEDVTAYNNIFRATRYASSLPHAAAVIEDGNHWVTSNPGPLVRGLSYNGTIYQTDVAAYRTAYTAATGRTNATTNLQGDFMDEAVVDNALPSRLVGNLTPTAPFISAGVIIPNFSQPYVSGTVRAWHYSGAAPDVGAIESVGAGGPAVVPNLILRLFRERRD